MFSMKGKGLAESLRIDFLDRKGETLEKNFQVSLGEEADKFLRIGSSLRDPLHNDLIAFLKDNIDMFS